MDQIREGPIIGIAPYEGIRKFLFCISTDKLRTSCCCGLFTLRAAIYIFAILDIIGGSFGLLALLASTEQMHAGNFDWELVLRATDALVALPAILAIHGAANANAKKISYYYHAKILQLLIKPVPFYYVTKQNCMYNVCTTGEIVFGMIFVAITLSIYVYQAHVFYSYVNLVVKGETVLANNGGEVVQAMQQYRHQAAALDMQPYPAVVIGAPAGQVQIGEAVTVEKPTTPSH